MSVCVGGGEVWRVRGNDFEIIQDVSLDKHVHFLAGKNMQTIIATS